MLTNEKAEKLARRKRRVRQRIFRRIARPRSSVFRSKKHIYAQIIDDINGKDIGCGIHSG